MNKKKIAVLAVMLMSGICGCGQKTELTSTETLAERESLAETEVESFHEENSFQEEPPVLQFVDAHEEWHEVLLQEDWKKHSYDLSGFSDLDGKKSYESTAAPRNFRLGVDVSAYQGQIDWKRVLADGYDFAFIRIGFRGYGAAGNMKVDDYAVTNLKNAKEAGLDVGVYFFSQAISEEEAVAEAEFVFQILEEAGFTAAELTLPIVFDPESILGEDARTDGVSGQQFTQNSVAFCQRVIEEGYEPMIYCNMMWEAYMLDLKALAQYPIWYADYEPLPQTPYDFSVWQYSESSKVDGIQGAVDTDIWIYNE